MFFSQTCALAKDLAAEVSKKILDLKEEIVNISIEKKEHEFRDHKSQDCLVCNHQILTYSETANPPYGSFTWLQAAKHVYYYTCHLYVNRYPKDEIMLFLQSLENTNFFSSENVNLDCWTLKFSNLKDILIVEKL